MRKSLIAVRKAAATVLFVLGVGALAGLASPVASAAPVQAGVSQSPASVSLLPEFGPRWNPCDFRDCRPQPQGCWQGCGGQQQWRWSMDAIMGPAWDPGTVEFRGSRGVAWFWCPPNLPPGAFLADSWNGRVQWVLPW